MTRACLLKALLLWFGFSLRFGVCNLSTAERVALEELQELGWICPNQTSVNFSFCADCSSVVCSPTSGTANERVQTLVFEQNVSGALPNSITALSSLLALDLPSGNVSGVLPESLGQLTALTKLSLFGSSISGTLPASLSNLTRLQQLHLTHVAMSGSLPAFPASLTSLRLSGPFTGELSKALLTHQPALKALSLAGCSLLSGSLPDVSGLASSLRLLDLSGMSSLSGTLPASLGSLTQLERLRLDGTGKMQGALPDLSALRQLVELRVSASGLQGAMACPRNCSKAWGLLDCWASGLVFSLSSDPDFLSGCVDDPLGRPVMATCADGPPDLVPNCTGQSICVDRDCNQASCRGLSQLLCQQQHVSSACGDARCEPAESCEGSSACMLDCGYCVPPSVSVNSIKTAQQCSSAQVLAIERTNGAGEACAGGAVVHVQQAAYPPGSIGSLTVAVYHDTARLCLSGEWESKGRRGIVSLDSFAGPVVSVTLSDQAGLRLNGSAVAVETQVLLPLDQAADPIRSSGCNSRGFKQISVPVCARYDEAARLWSGVGCVSLGVVALAANDVQALECSCQGAPGTLAALYLTQQEQACQLSNTFTFQSVLYAGVFLLALWQAVRLVLIIKLSRSGTSVQDKVHRGHWVVLRVHVFILLAALLRFLSCLRYGRLATSAIGMGLATQWVNAVLTNLPFFFVFCVFSFLTVEWAHMLHFNMRPGRKRLAPLLFVCFNMAIFSFLLLVGLGMAGVFPREQTANLLIKIGSIGCALVSIASGLAFARYSVGLSQVLHEEHKLTAKCEPAEQTDSTPNKFNLQGVKSWFSFFRKSKRASAASLVQSSHESYKLGLRMRRAGAVALISFVAQALCWVATVWHLLFSEASTTIATTWSLAVFYGFELLALCSLLFLYRPAVSAYSKLVCKGSHAERLSVRFVLGISRASQAIDDSARSRVSGKSFRNSALPYIVEVLREGPDCEDADRELEAPSGPSSRVGSSPSTPLDSTPLSTFYSPRSTRSSWVLSPPYTRRGSTEPPSARDSTEMLEQHNSAEGSVPRRLNFEVVGRRITEVSERREREITVSVSISSPVIEPLERNKRGSLIPPPVPVLHQTDQHVRPSLSGSYDPGPMPGLLFSGSAATQTAGTDLQADQGPTELPCDPAGTRSAEPSPAQASADTPSAPVQACREASSMIGQTSQGGSAEQAESQGGHSNATRMPCTERETNANTVIEREGDAIELKSVEPCDQLHEHSHTDNSRHPAADPDMHSEVVGDMVIIA